MLAPSEIILAVHPPNVHSLLHLIVSIFLRLNSFTILFALGCCEIF